MKIAIYSQKYKVEYHPLLSSIFQELRSHGDTIRVEADLLRRYREQAPLEGV